MGRGTLCPWWPAGVVTRMPLQIPDKAVMMKLGNEDPRQKRPDVVPSYLGVDVSETSV